MTADEIVKELKKLGSDAYKQTLRNHCIPEPFFGVKVEELQKFQNRIKQDYRLALDLYDTGIYDAMCLAGLIVDDAKMTKKDLRQWLKQAKRDILIAYTIPWVAAQSPHGWELALEWIESKQEDVASAGGATLRSLVSVKADADLDLPELKKTLATRAEDDSRAAEQRPLAHERLCHRRGKLREVAHGTGCPDGNQDWQSHGGYGRHSLQSSVRAGIHREGKEARDARKEAQVDKMLSDGRIRCPRFAAASQGSRPGRMRYVRRR